MGDDESLRDLYDGCYRRLVGQLYRADSRRWTTPRPGCEPSR
ncbi:hypothetical protein EV643_11758 [Kribbella sp. VKM Ac-2527]|uniref:Uncharacterized protein n=1 Tax=Kribbella caucasensis TaxID=2512215 RepID=A0A4R6K998_9ACTN|nr:hypothetical protein [Kribbella sp. VKM Ac-2527]TDO44035.1 hypothetical protein EV643_11758 [Kribbella sp. VKM Ac-2527]